MWRIWGLDRLAMAEDAGIVARVIDASTEIIMILLIADLIWSLIKAFLDERMSASNAGHGGDEGGVLSARLTSERLAESISIAC